MAGETILMVEDNPDILADNREALESEGYRVLEATTLKEAGEIAAQNRLDLVLPDIVLPDGNGLEACRELFGQGNPRILFLSALNKKEQVLAGLREGDGYLTKPYRVDDLLAQAAYLLERKREDDRPLIRGPLTLDVVAAQAFLGGEDMLLSQKEFALLLFLVQNEGKAVDKETVYQKVWGRPLVENSRALYTTVSRLKKKLEPCGGEIELITVRGGGYRLQVNSGS